MNTEIYKDIEGYEGLYQVSNLGNVKSLKRIKEKVLKQKNVKGYNYVSLSNEVIKKKLVHRLVATTFITNPDNKPQVNHLSGVKTDNNVKNLEWCTASENRIHAFQLGLQIGKKGIENPMYDKKGKDNQNSKIIYQYSLTGLLIKKWYSLIDVQIELNYNKSNLSKCALGKRK